MANKPGVVKTGGGGKSKVARESKWVRDAKRFHANHSTILGIAEWIAKKRVQGPRRCNLAQVPPFRAACPSFSPVEGTYPLPPDGKGHREGRKRRLSPRKNVPPPRPCSLREVVLVNEPLCLGPRRRRGSVLSRLQSRMGCVRRGAGRYYEPSAWPDARTKEDMTLREADDSEE